MYIISNTENYARALAPKIRRRIAKIISKNPSRRRRGTGEAPTDNGDDNTGEIRKEKTSRRVKRIGRARATSAAAAAAAVVSLSNAHGNLCAYVKPLRQRY